MSKNIKGCLSHLSDDWRTPKWMYDLFMDKGYIDCFPYCSKVDQLLINYFDTRLFINPPYSKLNAIMSWLLSQIQNNQVVLLIPARTDTRYFFDLCSLCDDVTIIFIKGRLHFNESKDSAPFPSMLMLFNYSIRRKLPIYFVKTQSDLADYIRSVL